MVVDAQVEIGVVLGRVDERARPTACRACRRRPPRPPASPRSARRGKGRALGLDRRAPSRRSPAARPACCRRPRSVSRTRWPHQSTQSAPVWAAKPPAPSMTWSLPVRMAGIGRDEQPHHLGGRHAVAQQREAALAVERVHQGLGRDRADPGLESRHPRPDGEEFRRDRDADRAGAVVPRDDRPGHRITKSPGHWLARTRREAMTSLFGRLMVHRTPGSLRSQAIPCPSALIGTVATCSRTEPVLGMRRA